MTKKRFPRQRPWNRRSLCSYKRPSLATHPFETTPFRDYTLSGLNPFGTVHAGYLEVPAIIVARPPSKRRDAECVRSREAFVPPPDRDKGSSVRQESGVEQDRPERNTERAMFV